MKNLPISAPAGQEPALPGAFLAKWFAFSCLILLLAPARPAFPSETLPAATVAPVSGGAASPLVFPDFLALDLGIPAGSHPLSADPAAAQSGRFRSEFRTEPPKEAWQGSGESGPGFILQRGEYGGSRFGLLAEMGDIRIKQTLNTAHEVSGRGGKFSFLTGNSGNAAKIETFAAAGAHGSRPDDLVVGATGEISFLEESARFKTIFLSGRESLDTEGRWPDSGARRGEVLGFTAVIDPFQGKLAAEAELDYSVFDRDTEDDASAVSDSAYRLKLGGGWGRNRYTALYERTGPQYRLMSDRGPVRDSQGVSLGMATGVQMHAFDVKLSRYHNNTEKNELYPRLYRYEGLVDYRFKGFKAVPLTLQYRKTYIDSAREPLGFLPKEVEEDAVSGQVNYLAGKWDLGLRGGFSQRSDKLRQQKQSTTATLGLLPKFAAGPVTVAPDFSLRRVTEFPSALRTDHYAINLGVNGSLPERKFDYEVKGGFKKESTGVPGTGKQVVGAKVKAAYPLARILKWSRQPSLGIRGEYQGINNRNLDRRENEFSLLISLDGGTFM